MEGNDSRCYAPSWCMLLMTMVCSQVLNGKKSQTWAAFCTFGIDITILWAGLAKRIIEISCSRNLVAARNWYDARQTFYASSYENLAEKSV